MKGNNTLTLNEATMIEAVQEYLAKRMGATYAPNVTSVKISKQGGGYGAGELFEIAVTDKAVAAT